MEWSLLFFVNTIMLGIGLSMDAFTVSITNGLSNSQMKNRKALIIALVFGIFQGIMPIIGWLCVHTIVQYFEKFVNYIPWIALVLLLYLGIKMIVDGVKHKNIEKEEHLSLKKILIQGIATSIDALSVGFTIAEYNFLMAFVAVIIIALITFGICYGGVIIGKKFGAGLSNKAEIFGGIILILVGLEIFLTSIFG